MGRSPSPTSRRFGRYLRELRTARKLTQVELARTCRLAADSVSRIESGRFSPSLDTLVKLSKGLRIDLDGLFSGFVQDDVAGAFELIALARSLTPAERRVGLRILVVLAGLLGAVTGDRRLARVDLDSTEIPDDGR